MHLAGAAFDYSAAAYGCGAVSIGEVDLQQPLQLIERYGNEGSMLGSIRSMSADAAGVTLHNVARCGSHAKDLSAWLAWCNPWNKACQWQARPGHCVSKERAACVAGGADSNIKP